MADTQMIHTDDTNLDYSVDNLKNEKPLVKEGFSSWALRDSNPGPMDYESTALTN